MQGAVPYSIEIQILQNFKAVTAGEELLIYKEKLQEIASIEPKRKEPTNAPKAKSAKKTKR